jgi:(p)ppGpp synthase/HD superfamily hydrolase
MSTLEKAIALAVTAHEGQVDKAGQPYVLHPLRVMLALKSTEERIVGVLHDVIEDCDVSLEELREHGFSEAVVQALDSVTKRTEEKGDDGYQSFVVRAGKNSIGRRVKIADLLDNMDLTRLAELSDKDFRRLDRYMKALRYLEELESKSS